MFPSVTKTIFENVWKGTARLMSTKPSIAEKVAAMSTTELGKYQNYYLV